MPTVTSWHPALPGAPRKKCWNVHRAWTPCMRCLLQQDFCNLQILHHMFVHSGAKAEYGQQAQQVATGVHNTGGQMHSSRLSPHHELSPAFAELPGQLQASGQFRLRHSPLNQAPGSPARAAQWNHAMGLRSAHAAQLNLHRSAETRAVPGPSKGRGQAHDTELLQPTQQVQASESLPGNISAPPPWGHEPQFPSTQHKALSQLLKPLLPHTPAWLAPRGDSRRPAQAPTGRGQHGAAGKQPHAGRRAFTALPSSLALTAEASRVTQFAEFQAGRRALPALPPSSPATP
jgi:hypothetical protein